MSEAGNSFCFPLMERRLLRTGAGHALRCIEDLALKSYVASRCACRKMAIEHGEASRMAGMEQKIARLEREKTALEASLTSSHAKAEAALEQLKTARQEADTAKAEAVEAPVC